MRLEAHVDIARAKLRKAVVVRSFAERLDGGRGFLVAHPLGRPRLWTHSTNAVVEGFRAGLAAEAQPTAGAVGRGGERLRAAICSARDRLFARCETLIERDLPDVGLAAALFESGTLHVHALGPCRAYLHRRRQTERITARDEEPGGLLTRAAAEAVITLDPGDLVLMGTVTAFTSAAVARVASVLEHDPDTSVQTLAQLLTEPAEQAGTGAAVIVLRAR